MRNGREVKLDPEERILATPDDEAELDDANEHGAGAQIEFMRISSQRRGQRRGA